MSRRLSGRVRGALAALFLPSLVSAAPPAPRRVVMVSFDGAGGHELTRRVADGTLGPDGFRKALAEGLSAERLAVVTPSATSVSHASISTGVLPQVHGIVANTFHRAGESLLSESRGFWVEPAVETIWEAAARQGKRVASIAWPGLSQRTPRTTCAVALEFGEPHRGTLWRSGAKTLLPDAAFALPAGVTSFSPPKALPQTLAREVRFVLVDGRDDGRRAYDGILAVARDGTLVARARAGEWFAVNSHADDGAEKDALFGRWSKLTSLAPDLSNVTLYVGPKERTRAHPEDFRRTVEKRAGFWPGSPDPAFLAIGDTASFLEQSARLSEHLAEAFRIADRRGDWDLLLGYDPVLDDTEHPLYLVDAAQPHGSKERLADAAAALTHAWRVADRTAAAYLSFASRGDVFFVSDHGTRPAYLAYHVLEDMRRLGWVKTQTDADGAMKVAPDSPVTVFVAGSLGFVVVNRAGKIPGGVVPDDEAGALVKRIAAHLREELDEEGHPLLTVVATPSEAQNLGLDTPNAGDLVMAARSGVTLKIDLTGDKAPIVGPADQPGQHGGPPDPELDGIFVHVGDGVPHESFPVFREIDVAAAVAKRLGISPPGTAGSPR